MYNQNWHVVYGPTKTGADISPDTQVTDAWEIVWRMQGNVGDPGPQIVVNIYGEYNDPNGQRNDGSWPDVVITAQICYEIREANGEVNDADYEYRPGNTKFPDPLTSPGNDAVFRAAEQQAQAWAVMIRNPDWDWNGVSAMHRAGGRV